MDVTVRREQYPLLGEPIQMFAGENVYVINERAIKGKTYSFICPQCHAHFVAKTLTDEVNKIKCPDCETYVCFSTRGKIPNPDIMRTQVIADGAYAKSAGVLVWTEDAIVRSYSLNSGSIIIGRRDEKEPSDISVDDATASRQSVKLEVTKGEKTGRHTFRLTILRTTNAVYVNRNALYANSSVYLNYGDTVRIGETVFTLMAKKH